MKKLTSTFLALLMIFSLMAPAVSAAEQMTPPARKLIKSLSSI